MRNRIALVAVSSLLFAACSDLPVEETGAETLSTAAPTSADMAEPESVEDMVLPPGDVATWRRDFTIGPDIAGCRVATDECRRDYDCCGGAADCVSVGAIRVCCIHAGQHNWIEPGPVGVGQKKPAQWCCPGTIYNAADRTCD